jgi:hypothetical protein
MVPERRLFKILLRKQNEFLPSKIFLISDGKQGGYKWLSAQNKMAVTVEI